MCNFNSKNSTISDHRELLNGEITNTSEVDVFVIITGYHRITICSSNRYMVIIYLARAGGRYSCGTAERIASPGVV